MSGDEYIRSLRLSGEIIMQARSLPPVDDINEGAL